MTQLCNFEDTLGENESSLDRINSTRDHLYDEHSIKKKRGSRKICVPHAELMNIQRLILKNILYKYSAHRNAHGFVPQKSRISNAIRHISKPIILKIDIHDFFPSITSNRIYGLFMSLDYSKKESIILTKLCTYKDQLPQGAPTSPYLSNLICVRLDARLSGLAKINKLNYSRYADDMIFSGNKIGKKMFELIQKIILEEGFKLNKYKTKIKSQKNRQDVTGLILNNKLSIGHKKYNSLKAKLHALSKKPIDVENVLNYKQQIMGEISIYKPVDSWKWYKLMEYFNRINWTNYEPTKPQNKLEKTVEDIHILILALNSKISDVFKPRKEIFEALKNDPKTSVEVFSYNIQKLHLVFTDLNNRLHYFFTFLSEQDKEYTKSHNKYPDPINLMRKFALNNNLDVEILNEINALAAYPRHPGKKLTKRVNHIFEKYNCNHTNPNYSKLYILLIENYKIMLESLLKFVQDPPSSTNLHQKQHTEQ